MEEHKLPYQDKDGWMVAEEGPIEPAFPEIKVAPFRNKKAREKAAFICDEIDDQVEIEFAYNLAKEKMGILVLEPGIYCIGEEGVRLQAF